MQAEIRAALLAATPIGEENAMVAADIDRAAKLSARSAGTRLNAISLLQTRDGVLKSKYYIKKRQNLWWKTA